MKVKYCGSALDYSGYGEANRHDIASLVNAGVHLTTEIPRFTHEIANYGKIGELARSLEGKELGYRIKILHVTPNIYPQFFEEGKYHIGRVFWETDQLPLDFAKYCEQLDEIWTGSQHNHDAIRKAGVTTPIYIIPEAIDVNIDVKSFRPYLTPAEKHDFNFYSIFEWTERKNPTALLKAYWTAFENNPNVSLTIKTYVDNFRPEKKQYIKKQIAKVKYDLKLKHYAPLYIYSGLLNREQMYRFHRTFDCFVSAHRGEGWGIPQMEALLMGNPIISTNWGGIHEYLGEARDAQLIDYELVQVKADRNKQWYAMNQQWADVNVDAFKKAMLLQYDTRKVAPSTGLGADIIKNKFSFKAVGKMMLKRLLEIDKELQHGIQT